MTDQKQNELPENQRDHRVCPVCKHYNAMLDHTTGEQFHKGIKVSKCRDCGHVERSKSE